MEQWEPQFNLCNVQKPKGQQCWIFSPEDWLWPCWPVIFWRCRWMWDCSTSYHYFSQRINDHKQNKWNKMKNWWKSMVFPTLVNQDRIYLFISFVVVLPISPSALSLLSCTHFLFYFVIWFQMLTSFLFSPVFPHRQTLNFLLPVCCQFRRSVFCAQVFSLACAPLSFYWFLKRSLELFVFFSCFCSNDLAFPKSSCTHSFHRCKKIQTKTKQ